MSLHHPNTAPIAATAPASSATRTLYRDALQAISEFLDLQEFVRMCMVDSVWYRAGSTIKPRGEELTPLGSLDLFFRSPLRIHISHLILWHQTTDRIVLSLLCERMGHLQELKLRLKFNQADLIYESSHGTTTQTNSTAEIQHMASKGITSNVANVVISVADDDKLLKKANVSAISFFTIPPKLQVLFLELLFDDDCNPATDPVAPTISAYLKQLAAQSTKLVKLQLTASLSVRCELNDCLHELQSISTLTDITIAKPISLNSQIDLIKSMPSIKLWLTSEILTAKHIERLADGSTCPPSDSIDSTSNDPTTASPNATTLTPLNSSATSTRFGPSQLEHINAYLGQVDETMAFQLRKLKSLTQIHLDLTLPNPTRLLPHFPRLTHLYLRCSDSVDANDLSQALAACVHLTDLCIIHTPLPRAHMTQPHALTNDHLCRCLPHLTSLVSLKLNYLNLISLQFLTTAKTTLTHLRSFHIYNSDLIPTKEYHHLQAISQSLEELIIYESSTEPFDSLTVARWTPNSNEFRREDWPRLNEFHLTQIGADRIWVDEEEY